MKKAAISLAIASSAFVTLLLLRQETPESQNPPGESAPADDAGSESDWVKGWNAALFQFATEDKIETLAIMEHQTKYTSSEDNHATPAPTTRPPMEGESPYAYGYHQALEAIERVQGCPRP
jgi:hypothetical protein